MKLDPLTPTEAMLATLGKRLAQIRKSHRLSQIALAKEAGIGVATLRRIEEGRDGQLSSWIKILKALGLESSIDGLLPESFRSPLAEVQPRKNRRPGATDSGTKDFTWGDKRS